MKPFVLLRLACIGALLAILAPSRVRAQQAYRLIYESQMNSAHDMLWSGDSRFLVFQDLDIGTGPQTADESWFQYDVKTGETSKHRVWPLQPPISAAQQKAFEMVNQHGDSSFVFPSPDGRYAVYTGPDYSVKDEGWPVELANLSANTHVQLDAYIDSPYGLDYSFSVKWARNSHFFTVQTVTSHAAIRIYYVRDFAQDINDSNYLEIADGLPFGTQNLAIFFVYDLSPDGAKVLLGGWDYLLYWNVTDPSKNSIIMQEPVRWAAFQPGDASKVFYLNRRGLVRIDLSGSTSAVLDSGLNAVLDSTGHVTSVRVSPDGRQLAFISNDYPEERTRVYLMDISRLNLYGVSASR